MLLCTLSAGCAGKRDPAAEAPPAKPAVVAEGDPAVVHVGRPEQFQLTSATSFTQGSVLHVTGTVSPDVSRTIPVVSLANGRVLNVSARLGDFVKKGQLLMEVQSTDVSGAFAQYLKAQNDERLANVQLERAKLLFDKGAIARSQLEVAANSELDAQTELRATEQQLRVLGVDKDHPSAAVRIVAPATGVITAQNVTDAGATGATLTGSPTAFTIADLSHVWVVCDVYENDLPEVQVGQRADIRLNAYPDKTLSGTISDIGAVLDPSLRTAKVRIQVPNPDNLMRLGMFATATFHGRRLFTHAAVPPSAVLHLHDRDWVYVPQGGGSFQRVAVQSGPLTPAHQQEILSGIAPGQQVVADALALQSTAEE